MKVEIFVKYEEYISFIRTKKLNGLSYYFYIL